MLFVKNKFTVTFFITLYVLVVWYKYLEVQVIFIPVYVKRISEAASYLFGVKFSITPSRQKLKITKDIGLDVN